MLLCSEAERGNLVKTICEMRVRHSQDQLVCVY